ncbi:hypothetical protein [Finegoldia magna]|uniref:hypothetical protein n=1 Tax=Finegoldia magna TaxID=1260 RepID=UPI001F5BD6F3|nr:hypothetical protein [Finegoldia magna]
MDTRYELKDVDRILNIEGFFGGDQQWFEYVLHSNYLTKKRLFSDCYHKFFHLHCKYKKRIC